MSDDHDIETYLASQPHGMGALNEKLGIELVAISPERVVATMPVEGNTQIHGVLHGGASVALAETVGSVAASLHAMPDKIAVGVDINATHHRAVRDGVVTGVATPIYLGRTTTSYEVVVTDDRDKRVCTARITCQLIQAPPGS